MNDRQEKYFQFPLFMLRPLITEPRGTLSNIFRYGFFRYAFSMYPDKAKVADRVLYAFNTDKPMLSDLRGRLSDYEGFDELKKDYDYRGFTTGGKFDPDDQREDLLAIFKNDPEVLHLATNQAQIETAIYNLKVFYQISILEDIAEYWDWYENLEIPDKEWFPHINISLLVKYLNSSPAEHDLVQLAAFIGANSIMGKAKYKSTNKGHLVARMLGYKSVKDLPGKRPPLFDKYTGRYHFERLRSMLEMNWKLKFFSVKGMHGFYIGQADQVQNMAFDYRRKLMKTKLEQIKAEKKEAWKQAKIQFKPDDLPF